jgi:hypothetical protein
LVFSKSASDEAVGMVNLKEFLRQGGVGKMTWVRVEKRKSCMSNEIDTSAE